MKKLFLALAVVAAMSFSTVNAYAQDVPATDENAQTEQVDQQTTNDDALIQGEQARHNPILQKFIEGGVLWMSPILLFLIFGLAIAIERILYLGFSEINTKKLIKQVEETLNESGIEAAMDVCRNTRGPVASIFYQGLSRYGEGLDVVEKSVVSYGSVQTGMMEKGLTWIALFIALSPMVGFMGTVVGMIEAFDAIQAAGEVSATLVAGGIKVALLTTMLGLISACILQLFYNYIINKIDGLVISMEDSSITLIDILTDYSKK